MFDKLGPIEKKIHVSWKNKNVLDQPFSIIQHGISNLKKLNPDYTFFIYDDQDIETYLQQQLLPQDYELIKNKKIVEKTDLWRLFIMYNEGGIYQDIDRLCNIPLSDIININTKCVLPMYYYTDFSQDFMCSSSKNIIFKKAIDLNLHRRRAGCNDIMYLGPHTYFHAITETLLGKQIHRDPGQQIMQMLQKIIHDSPYLETYVEQPPYNTIIYRGPPVIFDKDLLYKHENVRHWAS